MATGFTQPFGDGEYPFKLTVNGILELQEKTKVGFGELFARVVAGQYKDADGTTFGYPLDAKWHLTDLLETIRLGLIGGGLDPVAAKTLVERYCYPEQPLSQAWTLAAAIMTAAIEGIDDKAVHPVKKKSASATTRKAASKPAPSSPT